ncbi:hypothetical protein D3C86_1428070 [compost metagenome]
MHLFPGALQVRGLVQVLAVDQGQEMRVFQVVLPGEAHQFADRFHRLQFFELELALGLADVLISQFKYRFEQAFLVAEILVNHPFIGLGSQRDAVNASTAKAQFRKLDFGRIENSQARGIGIASRSDRHLFGGFLGHLKRSPEHRYCSSYAARKWRSGKGDELSRGAPG